MGLFGDIAGKVVLKYEADTAQAKIALRELTGEQKANAKAAIQGMEDQKAAHDRMVKGITVGLGLAAGAVAIGVGAYKAYEQQTRLTAASAGADMDRLRSASHGLMTDIDLMSVAAAGMNGRFKLSSDEMAKVLEAAIALERRGFGPLDEITKKLGEAIKKGEIDPLKELGVSYDETLAKTDKRAAALKALGALSHEAAAGIETETEAIRRQAVEAENYWDRAKAWTGGIVHDTIAGWGKIVDAGSDAEKRLRYEAPALYNLLGLQGLANLAILQGKLSGIAAAQGSAVAEAARKRAEDEGFVDYTRGARMDAQRAAIQKQKDDSAARAAANRAAEHRGGGGGGGRRTPKPDPYANDVIMHGPLFNQTLGAGAAPENPYLALSGMDLGGGGGQGFNRLNDNGPSFMERMLGPVDQFDAYASAWGGFQGAVTAGYEALVTGSESFGKAAKRVIGQTIMAEGSHMLVLALREGAQAIASLAGGNFAAAGTHGLAAAKFGAGAALAGVVAHSLGAGGAATGAASAGGASVAGSSTTAADNAPRNTNIVLGHGWDDETNRQRAARFARAQRQAASYESPAAGVIYG